MREWLRHQRWARNIGDYALRRSRLFRSPAGQRLYRAWIRHRIRRLSRKPPFVHIETTNWCNARCTMCSYPQMQRPKGYMSPALFTKVLGDCRALGVRNVNLQFLGEPLLDRQIAGRVREAREAGLNAEMVTNASLLTPERSEELIRAGLVHLRISFDGFSAETFERIRVNLDFEKVRENVLGFLETRRRMRSPTPQVTLIFIRLAENGHEAEPFHRFWADKVEHVLISHARDWAGEMKLVQLGTTYSTRLPKPPCNHLWEEMVVLQDGRVTICCDAYEGQVVAGDANRETLRAIWEGPAYRSIRDAHQREAFQEVPFCAKCKYYAVWW